MDKQNIRKTFFAGVIILAVALTACTASTPQPQAEPPAGMGAPQDTERITLIDSKAAFDSQAALFLDVRWADQYKTSHVPGAYSIPLTELETRISELDPSQWIITYCS